MRSTQWAVVPLWVAASIAHVLRPPFPPWAARAGGLSLLVLFVTYGAGVLLQTVSLIGRPPSADRLHTAARAVFLVGGLLILFLDGRPWYLGSTWGLFLVTGRLSPARGRGDPASRSRIPPSRPGA